MKRRPHSVTFIACLFIIVGLIAVSANAKELITINETSPALSKPSDIVQSLIQLAINCAALVGGVFLLRAANWARWFLVAWMAFHIGFSFLHSLTEVLLHVVLFTTIIVILFLPRANAFFHASRNTKEVE